MVFNWKFLPSVSFLTRYFLCISIYFLLCVFLSTSRFWQLGFMFEIFPGIWLVYVTHKYLCTYCRTSPCPKRRRSRGHIWPPRLEFCSDWALVKQRESQETEAALKPRPQQAQLLCLFHFYSHWPSSLRVHSHESSRGELAMRWLGSSHLHICTSYLRPEKMACSSCWVIPWPSRISTGVGPWAHVTMPALCSVS